MTAMRQHAQTVALRARLQRCRSLAMPWAGLLYRATTIEYANRNDLLTGVGCRKAGGRWTPPGIFNAVYASLEPEAAMSEALASYRAFGIPISEAMPLVFVAVRAKVQSLLDLTSGEVQQLLGVSVRRMTNTDWQAEQARGDEALTQAIGRIAWEEKLEGILVPSAQQKGAKNVVLFPSRRRRGSSWRILRARKLTRRDD